MKIIPVSLKQANAFVIENHRHHNKVQGHKFSIGVESDGNLLGVAIVGRPLSRYLDDGKTLEVLRLCTLGDKNTCSMLYGRCARIAKEMGFSKIITYILQTEKGTSLKASGWKIEDDSCGGGSWSCNSRPRVTTQVTLFGEVTKYPIEKKQRWSKIL